MAFEFKLPDIGEGVHEGEIVKWHVATGDVIQEDAPMVEVMTDKVTVEITSPVSGRVGQLMFQEGQVAKVGQVIVSIESSGEPPAEKILQKTEAKPEKILVPAAATSTCTVAATTALSVSPVLPKEARVLAPPAVRKLAREMGVSLAAVVGSGPKGRIRKPDVMSALQSIGFGRPSQVATKAYIVQPDTRLPFKGIRRKIAEHLVHSKQTAPHFTYVDDIDMSGVVEARAQLKPLAQACDVKLTYLPFILKAVLKGLEKYPILNSSLDEATQEIVLKGSHNIGVAMATEQGLVVPVIYNADQYSLFELSKQIELLSQQARQQKLSLETMQGGTFTLTSIGSIGGVFSAPIINHPEVAIIGIQKIEKRAVVRNDEIVIRHMTYLSISCDHRVVDGAEAAHFMNEVKSYLENPYRLLTEI